MSCECTTARVGGAKPSTIDVWQCFLFDIRDCIKEWLVLCFYCPSLSPSLLTWLWAIEYMSVVLFCYILDVMLCYVMLCVKKKKKMLITKKKEMIWVRVYGGRGRSLFCQEYSRFPGNRSKQSSAAPDFETCSAHTHTHTHTHKRNPMPDEKKYI